LAGRVKDVEKSDLVVNNALLPVRVCREVSEKMVPQNRATNTFDGGIILVHKVL
jgi:hypothetical protein